MTKSTLKTNKSAAKRFRVRGNGQIARYDVVGWLECVYIYIHMSNELECSLFFNSFKMVFHSEASRDVRTILDTRVQNARAG